MASQSANYAAIEIKEPRAQKFAQVESTPNSSVNSMEADLVALREQLKTHLKKRLTLIKAKAAALRRLKKRSNLVGTRVKNQIEGLLKEKLDLGRLKYNLRESKLSLTIQQKKVLEDLRLLRCMTSYEVFVGQRNVTPNMQKSTQHQVRVQLYKKKSLKRLSSGGLNGSVTVRITTKKLNQTSPKRKKNF